jgi:hypothetical protein
MLFAGARQNLFAACSVLLAAFYSMCRVDFMVKPNGLLVTVSLTYYYAYTPVLSTW